MDGGDEPIGDRSALERVRRVALGVHAWALGAAVVLTGLAVLLPER